MTTLKIHSEFFQWWATVSFLVMRNSECFQWRETVSVFTHWKQWVFSVMDHSEQVQWVNSVMNHSDEIQWVTTLKNHTESHTEEPHWRTTVSFSVMVISEFFSDGQQWVFSVMGNSECFQWWSNSDEIQGVISVKDHTQWYTEWSTLTDHTHSHSEKRQLVISVKDHCDKI
jgi:hypothetical protein